MSLDLNNQILERLKEGTRVHLVCGSVVIIEVTNDDKIIVYTSYVGIKCCLGEFMCVGLFKYELRYKSDLIKLLNGSYIDKPRLAVIQKIHKDSRSRILAYMADLLTSF